jgi:hypothetical protein
VSRVLYRRVKNQHESCHDIPGNTCPRLLPGQAARYVAAAMSLRAPGDVHLRALVATSAASVLTTGDNPVVKPEITLMLLTGSLHLAST